MAYSYPLPTQSESEKVATICRQIVKDMVTDVVGYIPELQHDWRRMGAHRAMVQASKGYNSKNEPTNYYCGHQHTVQILTYGNQQFLETAGELPYTHRSQPTKRHILPFVRGFHTSNLLLCKHNLTDVYVIDPRVDRKDEVKKVSTAEMKSMQDLSNSRTIFLFARAVTYITVVVLYAYMRHFLVNLNG